MPKFAKFLLVFVAASVAYLAYAAYSLQRTFDALASGQAANVERYADLEAIRASLKEQISAQVAKNNAGLKRNGDIGALIGAGVLSAFETGLANGMIDAFVTPQGVAGVLAGNNGARQRSERDDDPALWKRVGVESINTIRFSREAGLVAFFKFDGVMWKLVDIKAPFDDMLKNRIKNSGR